jgi:hypothetical protein
VKILKNGGIKGKHINYDINMSGFIETNGVSRIWHFNVYWIRLIMGYTTEVIIKQDML